MSEKITLGELKNIINQSDSEQLKPLKRLFALNDYMNEEYKKQNDGKKNPFSDDKIVIGEN